tara:strand:+ start:228 stop:575 length:348 start_codon:yes stop_codon:yes gene_type:complete
MKKLILILILFSSTSVWSNSGIYDCVGSENLTEGQRVKVIFKTIKEGFTFKLNSLTLTITKVDNFIQGQYRNDDDELKIQVDLNQALAELVISEKVSYRETMIRRDYKCKFTPTT